MLNLSSNISFKLQCTDCDYNIENEDIIESLVSISNHIEKFEHTRFELELYDFDLAFVKETIDMVKVFDEIDDSLLLSDISDKLRALNHQHTDIMIKDAIKNNILIIEDIEDDEIYLCLSDFGEDIWNIIKK